MYRGKYTSLGNAGGPELAWERDVSIWGRNTNMAGREGKKDYVLSCLFARGSWPSYLSQAHQLPRQALASANLPLSAVPTGKSSQLMCPRTLLWFLYLSNLFKRVCGGEREKNEYQHPGVVLRNEEERGCFHTSDANREGRVDREPACEQTWALLLCYFSPSKEDKSNGLQQIPGITK